MSMNTYPSAVAADSIEVYRVNWLRAKARYTRWKEEYNMVRHEMEWTVKYFQYREKEWQERRKAIKDDSTGAAGLQAYASKQAGLWRTFSEKAMARFRVEIPELRFEDW